MGKSKKNNATIFEDLTEKKNQPYKSISEI